MRGPFSAIFCRNVMIYFERDTQAVLVDRYAKLLDVGGVLFLGHSESLPATSVPMRAIGPSTYERLA
jgi:chemotaxis protein methyltransferase CheR